MSREYFPPSRPRQAKGGIKAQQRDFGRSWWARRWLAVLEEFDLGARLARGRSYARRGQVLSVVVAAGQVTARVQGSRARPYAVSIRMPTLTGAEWDRVVEVIGSQAVFAAKLLGGEMPEDIEEAFRRADLSLFPRRGAQLVTECSCPDWSNPCKHIAAVYCLLGEEFDRDPFLIFRLRGMEREELLGRLGALAPEVPEPPAPEPLPEAAERFWEGGEWEEDPEEPAPPPVVAALPKRLGSFPFWRGERPFLTAMEELYRGVGGQPPGAEERRRSSPGGKSRDRAALAADLAAGVSWEELRRRYDGRLLRPHAPGGRTG